MKKIYTLVFTLAALYGNSQPCIPNTNSVQFDGLGSQVTVSPQTGLDITSTLTIEAWIKPASFGFDQAQNSIVCKHGWSSGEGGFVLRCGGSGELSFNIAGIDPNQIPVSWVEVISSTNVLPLNGWTHVAGTFDGTAVKCYVNGSLAGTISFIGTIAQSTAYPLAIGRLADPVWGPDRYFSGSIDEVRIWNRALSDTELQAGMNNHIDPSSATGLVSYWRMNEGTNSTLYDVARTNNGGLILCTWDTSVPFNAVPPTPVITYMNELLTSSAPIGNQWYLDGVAIGGATQNTFTPLQNGIYTVEVTSPQGCTAISAGYTVTDVSIAEQENEVSHSLYPNPFSHNTTLKIQSESYSGALSMIISDLQGRVVRKIQNIEVSPALNNVRINIDLASGTYFYRLQSEDRVAGNGKMIVE